MARGNSKAASEFSKADRGKDKAYNPGNFRRAVEANAASDAISEAKLEKALDFGSATAPRLSDKTRAARDNRDMTSTAVLAKGVAASVAEVVTGIRGRLYPNERLGESYRVVDQQIAEVAKHIITETAKGKKDFDDYIEEKKYDFSYGMGTLNIGEKIVELGILEAKERLKSIK